MKDNIFSKIRFFVMTFICLLTIGDVAMINAAEPTQGEIKVLSYNVAGLAEIIGRNNPYLDHERISPLLNDYDIVGVQENFDYDKWLTKSITRLPYRNIHTGKTGNGDGLNVFSKFRVHTTRTKTWFYGFGNLTHGADENTPKGFSMSEVELTPNVFIHVYNLHADAGSANDDNTKDKGSCEARRNNIREVVEHIKRFSADRAVIVMGDTNGYYFRDSDELKESLDMVGLKDPIIELNQSGVYPTPIFDWVATQKAMSARDDVLEEAIKNNYETVDKIFYRSGGGVTLEAIEAKVEFEKFSYIKDGKRVRMSDHSPVYSKFRYTIDRNTHPEPKKVYLSDYPMISATSGWGYFKPDSSVAGVSHSDFNRLEIQNMKFSKGMGVHTNSELKYNLNGKYKTFSSYIGIDDEVSGGQLVFEVWGDGRRLYRSKEFFHNTAPQKITVDITGVNILNLKVVNTGKGTYNHADWADAMVLTGDYVDPGQPVIIQENNTEIRYTTYGGNVSTNNGAKRIRRSDSMSLTADWYDDQDETVEDYADNRAAANAEMRTFYAKTDYPSIEYTFTGTGIDYYGQKDFFNDNEWYSQRPCSITRVYIDGKYYRDVHINNTTGELYKDFLLLEIRDLAYGEHTIKLEKITGEWMVLDSFRVYGAPVTLYNDNYSGVRLNGLTLLGSGWRISSNRNRYDYQNDVTEVKSNTAAFEYSFYGSGVEYIAPTDSSNGWQIIYIDGRLIGSVNTHANQYTAQQVLASIRNLERGWHTLRIENSRNNGSTWFRIDGFRVFW